MGSESEKESDRAGAVGEACGRGRARSLAILLDDGEGSNADVFSREKRVKSGLKAAVVVHYR